MAKDLAIVLNNGSLNSAVATALAAQKYRPVMVFVETTAKAGSRARAAYEQQVAHFKPYREHTLSMPFLSMLQVPGTAAAQSADPRQGGMLAGQLTDLLPIVSVAARYGAHYQASAVYLGLRVGTGTDELAQATEYVQIMGELLQLPCGQPELEVTTPLLELEPWQVVDVGFQVKAPLERGWSCLEETPEPCWACRGCKARDAAFQQAAKADPLRSFKKI
jgi:7-cyano-7-deazaguanine synthase in queuosine biosynthesis